MNRSIVTDSINNARKTVLLAFAVSAASVAVLVAELALMDSLIASSAEELRAATLITGDILLIDEQLTSSAELAVATGDEKWVARYEHYIPILDRAIARATQLDLPLGQRFVDETNLSNDHLVRLERQAFDLLRRGQAPVAKSILEGAEYSEQKRILAQASQTFSAEMVAMKDRELRNLRHWGLWITLSVLFLTGLGLLAGWQRLTNSLKGSRDYFLKAEQKVQWLACHDTLTGLPNRHNFVQELNEWKTSLQRGEECALFLIDLDRFKPVNELYGHRLGDEVLRAVGHRLKSIVGGRGLAARLGGDEFGILMPFASGKTSPVEIAQRIVHEIPKPIRLAALSIKVGATVGLTMISDAADDSGTLAMQDGSAAETAIRQADMALHQAKTEGRGRYHVFTSDMEANLLRRIELERECKTAIKQGQIIPYYQPVVEIKSGRWLGLEVLARWNHPIHGVLNPSIIIPIVEDTGAINEMTCSLLSQALDDARFWPGGMTVSINLSPNQFGDHWLVGRLLSILTEHSYPPERLEIEITETALIDNVDAVRATIESLHNLGVKIALDDFGAGFAGLTYLRDFKFDRIKIDRSFVTQMLTQPKDEKLVEAILCFGRALGVETTAEGVENHETCRRLLELGCRTGQGFYFGKPQPQREIRRTLANRENKVPKIA